MAELKDAEQAPIMARELWETVLKDEDLAALVRKNGLTVLTTFRDPEFFLWISPDEVITGDAANKDALIKLNMTWEVGTNLYSDKLGLTPAISSGQMKVRGPMLKLMKIVPLLKKAHSLWPDVCKKYNIDL